VTRANDGQRPVILGQLPAQSKVTSERQVLHKFVEGGQSSRVTVATRPAHTTTVDSEGISVVRQAPRLEGVFLEVILAVIPALAGAGLIGGFQRSATKVALRFVVGNPVAHTLASRAVVAGAV